MAGRPRFPTLRSPSSFPSAIDARFRARIEADPDRVYPVVADLATYPKWMGIVHGVEVVAPHGLDEGPAWAVDLGAKVGPFLRTKRVRMVRTSADRPSETRFERRELDGQPHATWRLEVALHSDGRDGTEVAVALHYSGAPTLPLIEVVLAGEAWRAGRRLGELVAQQAD